jgi:hypothetical protein
VVVLDTVSSYEATTLSRLYNMQDYYSFIFGVLRHYDLPDLMAAYLDLDSSTDNSTASDTVRSTGSGTGSSNRLLVVSPMDPSRVALLQQAAASTFRLPAAVSASGFKLVTGSMSFAEVASWIAQRTAL